jgi:hypothetical protein
MTATVTRNGSIAIGQRVIFTWHVKGDSQTPQPGASATTGANSQVTYKLENPGNTIRVVTVTAALESDPKITATTDVRFGPPGFIALSERPLNWSDAKAFCQQQGGRLPRINNSDSWAWSDRNKITYIDVFGAPGAPWPSYLPGGHSWTDTEDADSPGYSSWFVNADDGKVYVQHAPQSGTCRVLCVPSKDPAPAPVVISPTAPISALPPEAAPAQSTAPSPAPYPPLTADGKPRAATHLVRLENDTVELALQILAPGKTLEAIRIDNLGGVSSRWRSDGKEEGAPLSVSQDGNSLSSGSQAMNLTLGDAEVLLSLSLKDNAAFAGKATEFRVTVFFSGGERAMCMLKAQ